MLSNIWNCRILMSSARNCLKLPCVHYTSVKTENADRPLPRHICVVTRKAGGQANGWREIHTAPPLPWNSLFCKLNNGLQTKPDRGCQAGFLTEWLSCTQRGFGSLFPACLNGNSDKICALPVVGGILSTTHSSLQQPVMPRLGLGSTDTAGLVL